MKVHNFVLGLSVAVSVRFAHYVKLLRLAAGSSQLFALHGLVKARPTLTRTHER